MAKFETYTSATNASLAGADIILLADQSATYATKSITFTELDKRWVNSTGETALLGDISLTGANVGIGTSDIEAVTSGYGTIQFPYDQIMYSTATAGWIGMLNNLYYDTTWKRRTAATAGMFQLEAGGLYFRSVPTGTADTDVSGVWTTPLTIEADAPTNSVYVDSTGYIGGGIATPDSPLHIHKATAGTISARGDSVITLENSTTCTLQFLCPAGNQAYIAFGDPGNNTDGLIRYDQSAQSMHFGTATRTSDLNIDSSGNVGIGKTPSYQLELSTDSAGKPSTNTWTIVSDPIIKEDIVLADLDICYDNVKATPLKRFKYRDDCYTDKQVTDRSVLGFLAPDVEERFPKSVKVAPFQKPPNGKNADAIKEKEDLLLTLEDEKEIEVITAEIEALKEAEIEVIEDCKTLNNDQMFMAMYGAVQKLIQKVEVLESLK